ncbi:MAG TPA: TrmH family RNA methyltransferase, partial [Gemmatimonadales bacterium]
SWRLTAWATAAVVGAYGGAAAFRHDPATVAAAVTICTVAAAIGLYVGEHRRLAERAAAGPVALVAGREDSGLTNDELDSCDTLVTISTDPAHPSLNLAQAVAIMAYETWLARDGDALPFKPPRKTAPPATHEILEALFADWERALWAIDFFKTRHPEHVMRSFRELVFRAAPDAREASLLRAMGIEVGRYLAREGVSARLGPPVAAPPGAAES